MALEKIDEQRTSALRKQFAKQFAKNLGIKESDIDRIELTDDGYIIHEKQKANEEITINFTF